MESVKELGLDPIGYGEALKLFSFFFFFLPF